MAVSWFIESGRYYFSIYTSAHIGNLFGALIDEKNHYVGLRVIFRNRIGNIFKEYCLTGLGRCDDESTLSFADRGEHIHDSCRNIA